MQLKRIALMLFATAALASCDLPRTSQQICDCRFLEGELPGEYSRLDKGPSHFNEDAYWDDWDLRYRGPEFADAFENRATHWYRNEDGEAVACIVVDGIDQMVASIVLPADESSSEPLDARLIGAEHKPHRMFWERC